MSTATKTVEELLTLAEERWARAEEKRRQQEEGHLRGIAEAGPGGLVVVRGVDGMSRAERRRRAREAAKRGPDGAGYL